MVCAEAGSGGGAKGCITGSTLFDDGLVVRQGDAEGLHGWYMGDRQQSGSDIGSIGLLRSLPSSSQPAHKTPATKVQSENLIGSYNLWGNSLIPISLASSKVGSHFGLKTLAIKYQNDVTDKFHTTQIYVDCSTAKFSLFPDLPSGPRSVQGDTKLLVAARC
jgi:hypothetical protein